MNRQVNFLDRLLKTMTKRALVREKNIPILSGYFRSYLKERLGSPLGELMPESAVAAIIQDAYLRAAAKERDGRARHGEFYRALEFAAEQVVVAAKGDQGADPRIKGILSFRGVI